MLSKLFRINGYDLLKGLVVAVVTAVLASILKLVNDFGLDIPNDSWSEVLKLAVLAAAGYLGKQLVTDQENRLGGKW